MIQHRELRVGNLFSEVPFTENAPQWYRSVANIESYAERIIVYADNGDGFTEEELYPIPLTPQILGAAGFEYDEGKRHHSISIGDWNKEDLVFKHNKTYYIRTTRGERIYIKGSLQYLHQLQNLFYSLTGQELTINLHAAV